MNAPKWKQGPWLTNETVVVKYSDGTLCTYPTAQITLTPWELAILHKTNGAKL